MLYTEVEEKLKTSHWPTEAQTALLPVLPRLGKWSLSYVWEQLNTTGGDTDALEVAHVISQEPSWYELLQKGQTENISQMIGEIISSNNEVMQIAVLSNILDIRSNESLSNSLTVELSQSFDELEIKYLNNLPANEVASILRFRISSLVNHVDLLMEIKRYLYYKDSLDATDVEVVKFRQALENNQQLIGSNPKPMKEWIADFLKLAIKGSDRSAFNVAHYIANSAAAQSLSNEEKSGLSEILALYNWLLQPNTTAHEIESYESHLFNEAAPELVPVPTPPPAPRPTPTPVPTSLPTPAPTPSTAEQRRTVEDIKRSQPKPVSYNQETEHGSPTINESDAAKIRDLINHPHKTDGTDTANEKRGVTKDPTNIKIDEETKRLDQARAQQAADIQAKLAELRKRNSQK